MAPRKKRPAPVPSETTGQPSAPALTLRADADGTILSVRVTPRAARAGLEGIRAGALLVRLTAPPVEGAANAALVALLADLLSVSKAAVTIATGATSRQKTVRVVGLTPEETLVRLGLPGAW